MHYYFVLITVYNRLGELFFISKNFLQVAYFIATKSEMNWKVLYIEYMSCQKGCFSQFFQFCLQCLIGHCRYIPFALGTLCSVWLIREKRTQHQSARGTIYRIAWIPICYNMVRRCNDLISNAL